MSSGEKETVKAYMKFRMIADWKCPGCGHQNTVNGYIILGPKKMQCDGCKFVYSISFQLCFED